MHEHVPAPLPGPFLCEWQARDFASRLSWEFVLLRLSFPSLRCLSSARTIPVCAALRADESRSCDNWWVGVFFRQHSLVPILTMSFLPRSASQVRKEEAKLQEQARYRGRARARDPRGNALLSHATQHTCTGKPSRPKRAQNDALRAEGQYRGPSARRRLVAQVCRRWTKNQRRVTKKQRKNEK